MLYLIVIIYVCIQITTLLNIVRNINVFIISHILS